MPDKHAGDATAARVIAALDRYRVTSGEGFRLADHRSDDLPDGIAKRDAPALLKSGIERLSALQELLYANADWSLLVVLQARDAAGKDSTIKHVMSGVNPQGVDVRSFKAPGASELARGFLWRINLALPPRGHIGIFNRSHYEDALVGRVHPEILAKTHLPPCLVAREGFWADRLADIAAFEAYLGRQGTRVVKFFLDVGREEQRKRLLKRLETPDKTWKFQPGDLAERARWDEYGKAYEAAIAATATPEAPWYVIPADRKWFSRLLVAEAIIHTLEGLHLRPPAVASEDEAALEQARAALKAE